ncbi:MAG: hypothetical protein ACC642_10450 [Pseudomonadales bacterium]
MIQQEAGRLLQDRFACLSRINALLRRQFHDQRVQLQDSMATLTEDPSLTCAKSAGALEGLAAAVEAHLRETEQATQQVCAINERLISAGLGGRRLEESYRSGSSAMGLPWMLTPEILGAWSSMWHPPHWIGVYGELNPSDFEKKLRMHFKVHESLVLQQGEARVRETVLESQRLKSDATAVQLNSTQGKQS